jgi:hypothetical protein
MAKKFKFKDLTEVDNVMAQLPAEARSVNAGLLLVDLGANNGFEMVVPDQWETILKQVDKTKPAPTPAMVIPKSLVMTRLTDAGKIDDALKALLAKPALFARWFAPDRQGVNQNDPDTILFIKQLGLDPDAILARP